MYGSLGRAASTTWTNSAGGLWQTSGNWNHNVPTPSVDADFNLGNAYTVVLNANASAQNLNQTAGNVTLNLGGNTLALTGDLGMGVSGSNDQLTISNGSLTINDTALTNGQVGIYVAAYSGLTISGADVSTTTTSGIPADFELGGDGGLSVTSGTLSVAGDFAVGANGDYGHTAIATFSGGTVTTGGLNVGLNTSGQVTQFGNAFVTVAASDSIEIGLASGNNGLYNMQSGTLIASGMTIGGSSGNGTGNFNMTGGAVTIANTITVGATGTLAVSGRNLTTQSLNAASAGSFGFTGGTITINGGQFQPKLGSVAAYESPSPANFGNSFQISGSQQMPAALVLSNSGSFSSGADYIIVGNSGGAGILSVGSLSNFSLASGILYVGEGRSSDATTAAVGTLLIGNGGMASLPSTVYVGVDGADGFASITNTNSTLSQNLLVVGGYGYSASSIIYGGNGTLTISRGGQCNAQATEIGYLLGAGTATVDGAGSKLASGLLYVGDSSSGNYSPVGVLTLSNGGQAGSNLDTYVGYYGGTGSVSVSGGTLNVGGILHVGENGEYQASTGTLSIANAGSVTSNGALIGNTGGFGTVALSGAGSTWTNTGGLNVGNDGSGSVSANGTGVVALTSNAGVTNTGVLKVYSGGALTVASGASLSTQSLDISNAGSFSFTGGTITINGGQFTGPASTTTLGDGTSLAKFRLANATASCGSIIINSNATLGGSGTISNGTSAITVNSGGTISGGPNDTAIGTLTTGSERWNGGGTFLSKVASAAANQNDVLVMSGLTVASTPQNPFEIDLDGLAPITLAANQMLVLSILPNSPQGTVQGYLPDLQLTDSNISVPSGDHLALVDQYVSGTGNELVADVVSTTPEPTSLIFLGLASAPMLMARRRRASRENGGEAI